MPARGDLRAGDDHHWQPNYSTGVGWSMLIGCMRQRSRMQKGFSRSRALHVSNKAKVSSAWLPPRHRSITTPLLPWKLRSYCSRLMYTAMYTQSTALDRMLVSISLNQLRKVFKLIKLEFQVLEMCAIRLN